MIASLQGKIQAISFKNLIVDVNGVGYKIFLSTSDLSRLPKIGENIFIFIHTNIKEDALDLYGFLQESALLLFENLISVSGVGPKLGLAILSGMPVDEFKSCVVNEDPKKLTRISGVGKKGAERIVLELKDKLSKEQSPLFGFKQNIANNTLEDVRSAIFNLGYKENQVSQAIESVKKAANNGAPLPELLKKALAAIN